jgi:hypothetical protein
VSNLELHDQATPATVDDLPEGEVIVRCPLNVAERELSVLARQCLDRRIPDMQTLEREVAAWEEARHAAAVKVDWQFTTADARVKLKKLYPTVQLQ